MPLISFEEALGRVLDLCRALPPEERSVPNALGRFLTQPLVARHDSPRFDCSAVDGYAIASVEHAGPHRVVGCAEAGAPYTGRLGADECVRILTGAVVPAESGAIAMQEDCRREGEDVILERLCQAGDHVRRQGEEHQAGSVLLPPGALVTPSVVGLATAQGYPSIRVGRTPRVAILCTGNELRSPGEELGPGTVYASNASTLLAAVQALGLEGEAAVLRDDPGTLGAALRDAFFRADLVLTTGGISVGDRDHVRECALGIGVQESFWKVAMKPGKPVFFGLREGKPMFGLPGNPVAAMVAFQVFVRPALLRLMGASECAPPPLPVRLATPLHKRAGRTEFVRARLQVEPDGIVARPVPGQGSHMIGGMAAAEGLLHLPAERDSFEEGERVTASLLRWGMM